MDGGGREPHIAIQSDCIDFMAQGVDGIKTYTEMYPTLNSRDQDA